MADLEGVDGRLRDFLIEAARAQRTVSYSELEPLLRLDMDNPDHRRRIGVHLGAVSRHEVAHGRPMLSSVVLRKDESTPGRGFFNLAVELGLVASDGDEFAFSIQELKRTFDYWATR